MSEEELIETLREFEKNRVEQLEEPAKNLFYAIMKIADERDRLNNIINELEDSIVGKINVLYQVRGQSNAIQELSILLRQLRELKGDDKE